MVEMVVERGKDRRNQARRNDRGVLVEAGHMGPGAGVCWMTVSTRGRAAGDARTAGADAEAGAAGHLRRRRARAGDAEVDAREEDAEVVDVAEADAVEEEEVEEEEGTIVRIAVVRIHVPGWDVT